ncbi:MAG: T9SS type A sorting domain-containing protein [Bacteroidales bacterium]|nr:T9SS type A sorting domain-containing protein [Bacteroidales bacterium]MCK4638673.1 T9SS type A sorting domain-containing protein [Bacteroidales bacterium]
MKKYLLFGLALALSVCSYSQRSYTIKDVKIAKAPLRKIITGAESLEKNTSGTDKLKSSSSVKGTDIVTIIDIGQAPNAYGYGYAGGQRSLVWANDDLNAVTNIHSDTAGNLAYDLSLNNGQTFENNIIIYECQSKNNAAHYPNSAIYNLAGNINPANAWFTFFASTYDDLSGSGYCYGVANLANHADTTGHIKYSHDDFFYGTPKAFTITTSGTAWVVDPNVDYTTDSGVYQGNLIINQGTFIDNDYVYEEWLFDAPMTGTGYVYDEKIAFAPDGLTGYISLLGNNEGIPFSTDAVYPIVYKTTDGGVTWSDAIPIQLGGPDGIEEVLWYLTDEQIAELFEPPVPARDEIVYTTAFDHDIVVDALGYLHIGIIIGIAGIDPYSIVTASYSFAAFEIIPYIPSDYTCGNFLGSCKNFRGNFGDLTEDNRINASITTDGMIITMTWLDTQLEGVEENNQPDVYARGFNFAAVYLSGDEVGADLPNNVTAFSYGMWQSYFATTSHYTLTVGDQYIVPIVYEDMDPIDPSAEIQFKYIQDFHYTCEDFIYPSPCFPVQIDTVLIKNYLTSVSQNCPNPFNDISTVTVNLEKASELSLEVFNLTGQKVYEINNGKVKPGSFTLTIDASKLSPGVYFYTVYAGEDKVTKKMVVY